MSKIAVLLLVICLIWAVRAKSPCTVGEEFSNCAPACYPTCTDPNPTCNEPNSGCKRSCVCKSGLVRDERPNRCVRLSQCSMEKGRPD